MTQCQSAVLQYHTVTWLKPAWGLDFGHLFVCGGEWRHLIRKPPSHRRLSSCVGVLLGPQSAEDELEMCDPWLPWWCLRGRRQSGCECVTRVCKNLVPVQFWHSPAQWCIDIIHFPPPELLGVCVSMHIYTLKVFCYCCANMFKLMSIQVLTCPCTSLTGLIIHCCVETTPLT